MSFRSHAEEAAYYRRVRKEQRDAAKAAGDRCTRCTIRPRRPDRMTCQVCADRQIAVKARAKIKRDVRRLLGEE